ncbi:thiamine pyrophosphate-binding protein [Orrella sp. JC864]|uniref:thiamine pyrophosphate-binding protein n=1 Tax=Orrella sp. JC864 TaxID=3120298 RepID=UPI00300A2B7E
MNKSATAIAPAAGGFSRWWHRWRFHLSALLLVLPLLYLPRYFQDVALNRGTMGLGQRPAGTVQVGPWPLQLAEWETGAPKPDPAGYMKTFTMALCQGCQDEVRAVYLRVGKPRSLRAAGSIFFGSPHRAFATIPIPERTATDADLWLTAEGWDGSVHQTPWPIAQASPDTVTWLQRQGAAR